MYNGLITKDEKSKVVYHNLEESATIINMSRRTLDEYRHQIQLGRSFNYDFVANFD